MPHQLPPLNALRVFEVAARAGSYTEAARELHLTHGAVSRQIQLLEAALGQPLFRKEGQRMVPTVHAKAFAREVSQAFDHIGDASRRYGKRAMQRVVRVNAPATMAMRWLIPRLGGFRRLHPGVDVRVSTAFSNEPAFKGSFDVAIRRGSDRPDHFDALPLFREHLTVIAAPSLLAAAPLRRPADLAHANVVSAETRPGDWDAWLRAAGREAVRPAQELRFDHYFVTLQAVIDGLGVGIGPLPTLSWDMQLGRLAAPFADLQVEGSTYSALVPMDSDKPRHLRDFLEWLAACAAQPGAPVPAQEQVAVSARAGRAGVRPGSGRRRRS